MTEEPKIRFLPIRCPNCNGYGTVTSKRLTCHSCKGKGFVVIDQETGLAVIDEMIDYAVLHQDQQ